MAYDYTIVLGILGGLVPGPPRIPKSICAQDPYVNGVLQSAFPIHRSCICGYGGLTVFRLYFSVWHLGLMEMQPPVFFGSLGSPLLVYLYGFISLLKGVHSGGFPGIFLFDNIQIPVHQCLGDSKVYASPFSQYPSFSYPLVLPISVPFSKHG